MMTTLKSAYGRNTCILCLVQRIYMCKWQGEWWGGGGGEQIFSILELFLHHHVVTFAMPSGHFSCVSGKTSLKSECNVKCSNPNLNMLSSMKSSSGLFLMFDHCGESCLGPGFVAPFCLLEETTHLHWNTWEFSPFLLLSPAPLPPPTHGLAIENGSHPCPPECRNPLLTSWLGLDFWGWPHTYTTVPSVWVQVWALNQVVRFSLIS